MVRLYFALISGLALSACGATEPTPVPPDQMPDPLPVYEPLLGSDANSLSQLRGSVITASANDTQVRGVAGRVRHGGGKLVVSDGLFKLADDDGFDAQGEAVDGDVVLALVNPGGRYDHTALYTIAYTLNGERYSAVGNLGVATLESDMPTRGTARYTGDAIYAYNTLIGTGFGGVGTLDARADFANAELNATVTLTSAQNPFTREDVADPDFDRIDLRDLTILTRSASFTGASMQLVKNNRVVNVIGANANARVSGTFFGVARGSDSTIVPDEIAGVALLEGDNGNVTLSFIGD